jgi:hypothetical protein
MFVHVLFLLAKAYASYFRFYSCMWIPRHRHRLGLAGDSAESARIGCEWASPKRGPFQRGRNGPGVEIELGALWN